jgi:hypothetical protein
MELAEHQSDSPASKRSHRNGLRWLFVLALVVVSLLSAYVGTYYRLSRRGMAEAAECNMSGFLYIPMSEAIETEDLSKHYVLCTIYAPLNWIDRQFFGGDYPISGITFRLS